MSGFTSPQQVVIFSKTYCPYCVKAKQAIGSVMDMSNVVVVELDKRPDGDAIQDYLLSITGGRSVPRVFIVCLIAPLASSHPLRRVASLSEGATTPPACEPAANWKPSSKRPAPSDTFRNANCN